MIILITGATAGFGRATAELFAKNGWDLIICGRRKERLSEIASVLKKKHKIDILQLSFDISILSEVENAINSLSGKWKNIDVLVNNAGLASGLNPIQTGLIDDWEQMINTNIKGLLYMTRLISPIMIDNKKGHIINIGSVAGKEVYANGNVYCATKHAVDALNRAMRIDLLQHGIKVTGISPGLAETEFSMVRFKGDEERAKAVYKGIEALKGEDIAEAIYWAVNRPTHVNILDIVLTPTAQANSSTVIRK